MRRIRNCDNLTKEDLITRFVELVKTLDEKEKYKYHDRDDLDYYGIRDIESDTLWNKRHF